MTKEESDCINMINYSSNIQRLPHMHLFVMAIVIFFSLHLNVHYNFRIESTFKIENHINSCIYITYHNIFWLFELDEITNWWNWISILFLFSSRPDVVLCTLVRIGNVRTVHKYDFFQLKMKTQNRFFN